MDNQIANNYPLSMVRGTTENIVFTFSSDSVFQNGDIAIFGIKKRYLDNEYLFKFKTDKISDNKIIVKLNPEDSLDLRVGSYFYDLGLLRESDFFMLVECSDFILKPNITEKRAFDD